MFVVYNKFTGVEFDTFEYKYLAEAKVARLNAMEDMDTYEMRFEENR
jgi:hypothetical protein